MWGLPLYNPLDLVGCFGDVRDILATRIYSQVASGRNIKRSYYYNVEGLGILRMFALSMTSLSSKLHWALTETERNPLQEKQMQS